jgi:hypothetical protein
MTRYRAGWKINEMKELVLYLLVAISSTVLMGYSVHMVLGGLVEESTEHGVIAIVVTITVIVIGFMFWDVIKRRREM